MENLLLEYQSLLRLSVFVGVFAVMAGLELVIPRRPLTTSKTQRWIANIGIVVIDTVLLRLLVPIAAIGIAEIARGAGWGLFNLTGLPVWLEILLAVVLLDMVIYFQHVLFHAVPGLWRLHMVHHADLDYDVTTGTRFHPIEILLSMAIKIAVVASLGAPPVAVLIFEVLLNGTAMFNHANMKLPLAADRVVRLFVVTPDMHRVHHSVRADETNSNYGFNLPWWDRLFGTYTDQPVAGHDGMTIGLDQFREAARLRLHHLLALPFTGRVGTYPINRRDKR